jgi:hypothetical protein
MKKLSLILIFLLAVLTQITAQKINFQKYPSGTMGINKAVKINKRSEKGALGQLDYALNSKGEVRLNKINFASNYEIVSYGVGSGCSQGVMIDLRDGMVYGLPIDCPACDDGPEEFFDFKKNSFLFVNTFCSEKGKKTNYYLWSEKKKKFEKLN